MDRDGNIFKEEKFENSEDNFKDFLDECPINKTKIVMESTTVWEYIYDILIALKYKDIKLANPLKTKAIASARIKTDKVDAKMLADLLRAGLIAESYIAPEHIRKLQKIIRLRKSLVKTRTQQTNKIKARLTAKGIKLPFDKMSTKAVKWIREEINEEILFQIESYLVIYETCSQEIKKVEKLIEEKAEEDESARLLISIPGFGPINAMSFIAEVGDITRFSSAEKLCAFAGLVPSIRQSANTIHFGKLSKQARTSLKHVFIQASWSAQRTKETNQFQIFFQRLSETKGKPKAICATGRKMCVVTYAMLMKNKQFENHTLMTMREGGDSASNLTHSKSIYRLEPSLPHKGESINHDHVIMRPRPRIGVCRSMLSKQKGIKMI